jgi:hypothetical protein
MMHIILESSSYFKALNFEFTDKYFLEFKAIKNVIAHFNKENSLTFHESRKIILKETLQEWKP